MLAIMRGHDHRRGCSEREVQRPRVDDDGLVTRQDSPQRAGLCARPRRGSVPEPITHA